MKAYADGVSVPVHQDKWYRMVVDVPSGVSRLQVLYQPPWMRGILAGGLLVVLGIAVMPLIPRLDHAMCRVTCFDASWLRRRLPGLYPPSHRRHFLLNDLFWPLICFLITYSVLTMSLSFLASRSTDGAYWSLSRWGAWRPVLQLVVLAAGPLYLVLLLVIPHDVLQEASPRAKCLRLAKAVLGTVVFVSATAVFLIHILPGDLPSNGLVPGLLAVYLLTGRGWLQRERKRRERAVQNQGAKRAKSSSHKLDMT
jgi:hypothetical protein